VFAIGLHVLIATESVWLVASALHKANNMPCNGKEPPNLLTIGHVALCKLHVWLLLHR
jgi:hypothetical protein